MTRRSDSGVTGTDRPARRFSTKQLSYGRMVAAFIVGVSLCLSLYGFFRSRLFSELFAASEQVELDWNIEAVLVAIALAAAVEFAAARIGAGGALQATTWRCS